MSQTVMSLFFCHYLPCHCYAFQLEGGKAGPGATNEGVLANFFNSLLTKKTGAAPPGAAPTKPGGEQIG